jgi:hypothetical protein
MLGVTIYNQVDLGYGRGHHLQQVDRGHKEHHMQQVGHMGHHQCMGKSQRGHTGAILQQVGHGSH